jgi:lysophospholipase L1-like esterase
MRCMITDPAAKTVLCFGDSNTHGAPSDDPTYTRLPVDVRWPGQLQNRLGPGWNVLEEGLNGRTIDRDDPDEPGRNGRRYLVPCLLSHVPLDVIVLMLGTNDTKTRFGLTAAGIADEWSGFLDDLAANSWNRDGEASTVILVSPIRIDDRQPRYHDEMVSFDASSVEHADALAAAYADLAARRNLVFFDAATVARAGADGIHLTTDSHARLAEALAGLIRVISGARS